MLRKQDNDDNIYENALYYINDTNTSIPEICLQEIIPLDPCVMNRLQIYGIYTKLLNPICDADN